MEITKKVEECADKILKLERLVDFEGVEDFCFVCGFPLGKKPKQELREFTIKHITSLIEQEVLKELQFIVDCDYERHDIVQRIEQLKEK